MSQPKQNTNRWVILSHMSPHVKVGTNELFRQFVHAGYRFFNIESFQTSMSELARNGWLEKSKSPHWPEQVQYRLAAGITILNTSKSAATLRNMDYEAKRLVKARELCVARPS